VAGRSLVRRLGARGARWGLQAARLAGVLAVVAYFLFGATILWTRYFLLPHIDDWRARIETGASQALGAPVAIGALAADWEGLHPRLHLSGASVRNPQGDPVLLLPQVDVVFSWSTLLALSPRLESLTVAGPHIEVRRQADGRIAVAGLLIDPQAPPSKNTFLDWLLAQHRIRVRDATLHWTDERSPDADGEPGSLELERLELLITRGLRTHRVALRMQPPAALAGPLDLRSEFSRPWGRSDTGLATWNGRFYLDVAYADLPALDHWLHLVPAPVQLASARGALRAWVDFGAGKVTRLNAQTALDGVEARLGTGLAPLELEHLTGTLGQALQRDGQHETEDFTLNGLEFRTTDGMRMQATDLHLRQVRTVGTPAKAGTGADAAAAAAADTPEAGELQVNQVVLADWARIARCLPLPPAWREAIDRSGARGRLRDVDARWGGPAGAAAQYRVRGGFEGLGGTLPPGADDPAGTAAWAFENLSGTLDMDQDEGTLHLDSRDVHVTAGPVLGSEPVPLDALAGRLRWQGASSAEPRFIVDTLALRNADLELGLSGRIAPRGATPAVDLTGQVSRLQLAAVGRYLPLALPVDTRDWLRGGLTGGTVTGGDLRLRGPLAQFPFTDAKQGEFRVRLHVRDGRVDVAPTPPGAAAVAAALAHAEPRPAPTAGPWKPLEAIDGDLEFDNNRMSLAVRHARALGYELARVNVRIPDLDRRDPLLVVDGQGSGSLGEALRYVGASPLNALTGGWMAGARGAGPSRLRLHLEVPLADAGNTTVRGKLALAGDELTLVPEVAPFTRLTGDIDFTQRDLRIGLVSGTFVGGEMRLQASTGSDGSLHFRGSGNATPQGLRGMTLPAPVYRLLEHMRGQFRYSAAVNVTKGQLGIGVDSDLTGLAADLPEPLRKSAGEARPMRVELTPMAGNGPARESLAVRLGPAASVELRRVTEPSGQMRVERGLIALGNAPALPERGLLLSIDQPRVDADRWLAILQPGPGAPELPPQAATPAAGPDTDGPDNLVLRTGRLRFLEQEFGHTEVSAHHEADGSWNGQVGGERAAGALHWWPPHDGQAGRAQARLSHLALSPAAQGGTGAGRAPSALPSAAAAAAPSTPPSVALPAAASAAGSALSSGAASGAAPAVPAAAPAAVPTDLPGLDVTVEQFEWGEGKLGRLELQAQNVALAPGGRVDAWNLQKLTLANPDARLTASGLWSTQTGGARRMDVKFNLGYSNAGGVLGRLGIGGLLRNGSGKLEGDLSWRGSPARLDVPTLGGHLRLDTTKGQFLKADAGAGRLLGVFSLQGLGSRLTGDFRDLFAEGFAFDTVSATATVQDGVLATDDLILKGVNAVVRIKGQANLTNETQNLQVVVIPEINAGTASLAVALVNPAAGLASFLANFVLRKPLSAAFTNVYEITGPWADPQVRRANPAGG
jgi:uncharacterized protein (TIGR02099 family)